MVVLTREEIYRSVRELLVESWMVDESRLTEKVSLERLGADSVDYFDVLFRFEEKFCISIPVEELYCAQWTGTCVGEYITTDGRFNEKGVEALVKAYPHIEFGEFRNNPVVGKLESVQTVKSLVDYVEAKLGGQK